MPEYAFVRVVFTKVFYLMHQSKKLVALQYKLAQKRKALLATVSPEGTSYFTR